MSPRRPGPDRSATFSLADGAQVAVIGGGPAGSFFGIHLLKAARQAGRRLAVTIFEPKSFSTQGPVGCNKSAGILSPSLLHNMGQYGLDLPPTVQMGRIERFELHLRGQTAVVSSPGTDLLPATVYRGGGPKRADVPAGISFDGWLLSEAMGHGATVIQQPVMQVDFADPQPQVQTPVSTHAVDLVVLAAGVNGHLPALLGVDYSPPRTERMAQAELPWPHPIPGDRPGVAHVFLGGLSGLLFAALVPKGDLVSLSILGRHLPPGTVRHFLERSGLARILNGTQPLLCGCRPQIVVQPAQRFFDDRFVAIGDAAVTRLYKDGIGSAFLTARAAAYTAVRGTKAQHFAERYAPVCRTIQQDNRPGQLLFELWRRIHRSSWLSHALLQALDAENEQPVAQWRLRPAVWAILTGSASYTSALKQLCSPQAMLRWAKALRETN